MSFKDFIQKYKLKNNATSIIKTYQVLSSLGLSDAGIFLRDRLFEYDIRIHKLYPSKGTLWVCYVNENCFDSYGCSTSDKPSKIFITRNSQCLYSEYKIKVFQINEIFIVQVMFFI